MGKNNSTLGIQTATQNLSPDEKINLIPSMLGQMDLLDRKDHELEERLQKVEHKYYGLDLMSKLHKDSIERVVKQQDDLSLKMGDVEDKQDELLKAVGEMSDMVKGVVRLKGMLMWVGIASLLLFGNVFQSKFPDLLHEFFK